MIDIETVKIPAGGGCDEFWIAKHPVTVGQWNALMPEDPREGDEMFPVTMVNTEDIKKFITKLNTATGKSFRLPTEVEWCWAAGLEPENLEDYAIFNCRQIVKVCTKLPNEHGLYDMRGLVWEWAGFGLYNRKYVLRGGSWACTHHRARAVSRHVCYPSDRDFYSGFRVVG